MSRLGLDGVSVGFGDVDAVRDVSITVAEGEFFTLVGPSGCGKTTVLRTIGGFEPPDAGTVTIGGDDVAGVSPDDRNVGVVFQDYSLFPHMTVRENVAYGLRYRDPPDGVSSAERVDSLLDLVDLTGMGDRDPDELSGGQQQRVALARALAPGPDVLLLDEPLSALDARLRERLRVVIRDIQQELSTTTVYVTHDQAEALAISDRIAVMNDGTVEQVGTPETVYREPATRFVATFVGDNNLIEADVVSTDPTRVELVPSADEPTADDRTLSPPTTDAPPAGRTLTLSVRPEAIELDGDGAVQLPATVETTEFMGDAYRVHCDWDGRTILVKTTATEPPGGRVTLTFDSRDATVLEET